MQKCSVNTRTGTDKNGKPWYGVVIIIQDFETELQFVDKIHYQYLKSLEAPDNSVSVKTNQNIMLDFSIATNNQIKAVLFLFENVPDTSENLNLHKELNRIYVALENEAIERGLI